jgi:hypothetical protein
MKPQHKEVAMWGRVEHILLVPWCIHFDALECDSVRMERKYYMCLLKRELDIIKGRKRCPDIWMNCKAEAVIILVVLQTQQHAIMSLPFSSKFIHLKSFFDCLIITSRYSSEIGIDFVCNTIHLITINLKAEEDVTPPQSHQDKVSYIIVQEAIIVIKDIFHPNLVIS